MSPSSSIPCFIHVAPTPTHAKLKSDIYSFPTLGHRPGSEKKEFCFFVMIIGTLAVNIEGNLKTGFGVQPRKISLGTMETLYVLYVGMYIRVHDPFM